MNICQVYAKENKITETEYIPKCFKTGLTATLHKGKGKSTKEPKNHRAISLLPVVSKLFEKVSWSKYKTQ